MRIKLYGNLMNRLAEAAPQEPVQVGDGATIVMYSDRYAATIIEVSDRKIVVREDFATRTDSNGMSEAQSYAYAPNPNGRVWTFTRRKNGRYVEQGRDMSNGSGLVTGRRDQYRDFSF